MARLEAAKVAKTQSREDPTNPGAPAVPPPIPQGGPPPLPSTPPPLRKPRRETDPPPADDGKLERKPAHLLVAELESAERQRKDKEARARKQSQAAQMSSAANEVSNSDIAAHRIDAPDLVVKRRQIPSWIFPVVGLVVVGGIAAAYYLAEQRTPEVKLEVDPELIAREARRKEAIDLVEQGHALFGLGKDVSKVSEAIPLYEKAAKVDPEFARPHRALGVAYGAKGDDARAVQHYRRFIELDPKAPEADQIRAIVDKYEKKTAGQNR